MTFEEQIELINKHIDLLYEAGFPKAYFQNKKRVNYYPDVSTARYVMEMLLYSVWREK